MRGIKHKIKFSNYEKYSWDSTQKSRFSYFIVIKSSESITNEQKKQLIDEINRL